MGEGEWKTRKGSASYRRQWRKVHLGIDAETLEIRAIEVTTNAIGDAATLPDLLAQIPTAERITIVGGDGAYDLVRVNVEPLRQLGKRLLALHGCQGYLRLEGRAVDPACSLRHLISCSAAMLTAFRQKLH